MELLQQPASNEPNATVNPLDRISPNGHLFAEHNSEMKSSNAISVHQLTFSYDGIVNVLNNMTFDIPRGAKVAIVGANGSGKSTLMLTLAGLLKPDYGSVVSEEVGGFCLQDYGRYKLSIDENVFLGDITRKEHTEGIHEALGLVNASFADRLPQGQQTVLWPELGGSDLSEGQWQRLALARYVQSHLPDRLSHYYG